MMKRDYAKKRYGSKTHSGKKPLRRLVLVVATIALFVMILGGIGIGVFRQLHGQTSLSQQVSNYQNTIKNWLAERRTHLSSIKKKVEKVKQMANKEPEPIHFEFYDELPNMQVKIDEVETEKIGPAEQHGKNKSVILPDPINIADAEALEKELSAQLEKTKNK